jgi:hypothetical protein
MKWIQGVAVCLATLGFCIPQVAIAAAPQAGKAPVVTDVRLHESGAMLGQVVSPENLPASGLQVALQSNGKPLAVATSDKNGYFAFAGMQNGVYEVVAPEGRAMYRVWTPATAPPSAQLGALVVNGNDTVRGQHAMHGFRNLMANPWFVAGVIAAAVAIPVAIHNSKSSGSGN